jgi:hypothetical protein
MGGENPPRIDAGRGSMPRHLRDRSHRRRCNGKPDKPASRYVASEAVDEPIAHEPSEKAEHQHRFKSVGPRP